MRASLKLQEPDDKETLAVAYAVLEPDSKPSVRVVASVTAEMVGTVLLLSVGAPSFLQAVNSRDINSTPASNRSWMELGFVINS